MPSTGQIASLSSLAPHDEHAGQTVKDQYKVVVLGGARVGKTAIVHQFLYDEFPVDYFATVEEVRSINIRMVGVSRLQVLRGVSG